MPSIPKRVEDRLSAGVKKFQPVLALASSNNVNESDTVVILNDLLAEVFGYALIDNSGRRSLAAVTHMRSVCPQR